ncbi:TonB-dependent siderophore receptor [Acinetobacter pittii]|uniref:TonB-dependent receptor plug domain-containing protein n=1 Tax=Acinetobacter pittii TaxID=48296 RepID=UPI0016027E0F|nr:TonB-dependent receptor [Acinetobacter pittii]QNB04957.1 TonB-dependent receptor [Acinetobacter baumannii]MCY3236255.1 TonB-dependent receptor [Acinetobacter pittii]MCY3289154.1 TonB-dependent receptor [Acinetobacter pittii]MCY3297255.1 TonB-dependent receptor [Acinetobacter pittii]MCY3305097.1 TonB-dependent receptor [Acinetobacter pittii]
MYLNNLKYVGALKNKRSFIFVFVALFHPLESYAQEAIEQPQKQAKTDKVVRVAVTGSRISKAQKDGPTSVTVITAADIEKQGFSNAFDALNNLTQNTGFVQGADYGNTFTPAANAISLRGLGPNHTLTLINGHRVADYPVPYDGSVNFVNLANIPTAIIDRIEILNGGASAIYGSDAIAGVVNIILKKKTDGTQFNIKAGGTKEGGENLRLQLSGSKTLDKLSLVYGVELSGREPIWAADRDFMSSRTRLGEKPDTVVGRKNANTGKYLSIGGCQAFNGLFKGSVSNIGQAGADNCASGLARPTYWTVQTQNRSQNGYLGLDFGIRGDIGETSWSYEAAYNGSIYTSQLRRQGLLRSSVDEYFLGQQLGTDADGIPIYSPRLDRLSRPLTANEFESISGTTKEKDKSWAQSLTLSANGDVFKLPAGTAKLAAVAEIGRQGFSIKPDQALENGEFYNASSSGEYSGTRTRQALGAELFLPLAKPLNLTLSGRYDRYALSDNSIDKLTFGSGLEFRPHPTLLVRGNYATSFRAPDMNYLFLNKQKGYFASTTDYLRCSQTGQPLDKCSFKDYAPGANYTLTGNKELKPEEGKSYGAGFVWSPTNKFDISVDYWDIKIDNLVTNLSEDKILRLEADCRLGNQDINSAACIDALARVERNPANAVVDPNVIKNINIVPINAASDHTRGIDFTSRWRWKTESFGNFLWTINYSRVLEHEYQQSKDGEKDDYLKDLTIPDWRDRFNTSFSWSFGDWASTVLVNRYGKIPNGDQTVYLSPTYLVNWSGTYQISPKASASIIINNLFDKVKRDDTGGWPYYPVGSYSPFGRQGWLEFNYKF